MKLETKYDIGDILLVEGLGEYNTPKKVLLVDFIKIAEGGSIYYYDNEGNSISQDSYIAGLKITKLEYKNEN